MHHLAEELSDLPGSPPSTIDMNSRLQSSLLRWRSEDRGKEQWKGVVDVLRVRTQVNQCALFLLLAVPVDLLPSHFLVRIMVSQPTLLPKDAFAKPV